MGVKELKSDAELPWDDDVRLLEHPLLLGCLGMSGGDETNGDWS